MVFEKAKHIVINSADIKEIEKKAIEMGISESFMMEEAGKNSAIIIKSIFFCPENQNQKFAFVVGKNNNGGDGIVAAGILSKDFGIKCDLFFFADFYEQLGDLAKQKYDSHVVGNKNIATYFNDFSKLAKTNYPVVVDALFGTGFSGAIRKEARLLVEIVKKLKENCSSVVSLDVPSGIDGNDIEESCKNAVVADLTIAMGALKDINVVKPAKFCNGKLIVADIGIDKTLFEERAKGEYINNKIIALHEKSDWKSHKYKKGKTLIIAGSKGMSGAVVLAARAASKISGAVRCAVPESISSSVETNLIEPVKIYCNDIGKGVFTEGCFTQIMEHLTWADSVLIGPGIKRENETGKFVKRVVSFLRNECKNKDIILDADALSAIDTQFFKDIKSDSNNIVITPHEGEFKRLFKDFETEVSFSEKAATLKKIAEEFGISIILKGPDTYIAVPQKAVYMINFAGDYIAKAGSGDVLAGVVASVCSFSASSLEEKLCASVAIHSYAGERASVAESKQTVLPTDILEHIKEYFLETKGASIYA